MSPPPALWSRRVRGRGMLRIFRLDHLDGLTHRFILVCGREPIAHTSTVRNANEARSGGILRAFIAKTAEDWGVPRPAVTAAR